MATCQTCTKAVNAWLDSRPQDVLPDASRALRGGTRYDASPAGVADKRASTHERWRTLVKESIAAIRTSCAAGQHADPMEVNR